MSEEIPRVGRLAGMCAEDPAGAWQRLKVAADGSLIVSGATPTFGAQNANTVLAGPESGAPAEPAFRALVNADLSVHGHVYHTNRTRNLWLSAMVFGIVGAGPALAIVGPYIAPAWLLDPDAAGEYVYASAIVPEDWVSGTVALKIYYSMAAANVSKAVRLRTYTAAFADGAAMTATTTTDATVTVPAVANTLQIYTHTATITVAAGEIMTVSVARLGSHGDDTASGDLQFLGLELEYTADM